MLPKVGCVDPKLEKKDLGYAKKTRQVEHFPMLRLAKLALDAFLLQA